MPENAGQMQVSGKFQKGQSRNPRGKARGNKNRVKLAAEQLLQGESFKRFLFGFLQLNIDTLEINLEMIGLPEFLCYFLGSCLED